MLFITTAARRALLILVVAATTTPPRRGVQAMSTWGQQPGGSEEGNNKKVDICHRHGDGTYKLININENAVPAHEEHGDGHPGDDIPPDLAKNAIFGDDCEPTCSPDLLCGENGNCQPIHLGGGFECVCDEGWGGDLCDTCAEGWIGENCEFELVGNGDCRDDQDRSYDVYYCLDCVGSDSDEGCGKLCLEPVGADVHLVGFVRDSSNNFCACLVSDGDLGQVTITNPPFLSFDKTNGAVGVPTTVYDFASASPIVKCYARPTD